MELKLFCQCGIIWSLDVLIVPFMELKQSGSYLGKQGAECLNRTFYGIET